MHAVRVDAHIATLWRVAAGHGPPHHIPSWLVLGSMMIASAWRIDIIPARHIKLPDWCVGNFVSHLHWPVQSWTPWAGPCASQASVICWCDLVFVSWPSPFASDEPYLGLFVSHVRVFLPGSLSSVICMLVSWVYSISRVRILAARGREPPHHHCSWLVIMRCAWRIQPARHIA